MTSPSGRVEGDLSEMPLDEVEAHTPVVELEQLLADEAGEEVLVLLPDEGRHEVVDGARRVLVAADEVREYVAAAVALALDVRGAHEAREAVAVRPTRRHRAHERLDAAGQRRGRARLRGAQHQEAVAWNIHRINFASWLSAILSTYNT